MFEKLEIISMAQNLAAHSGARMAVIAKNVANADTPGFKAQDIAGFAEIYGAGEEMRATRAGHIGQVSTASEVDPFTLHDSESPNGNSVSLEMEMVKSAETKQAHEMALAVYRATSGIMRTSLGRG